MKLLSFADKEILGLIPAQAILDYDRAKEVLGMISQAQAKLTLSEVAPIVDKLFEALSHADFSNGVEAFGADEGRAGAWEHIKQIENEWKALIK